MRLSPKQIISKSSAFYPSKTYLKDVNKLIAFYDDQAREEERARLKITQGEVVLTNYTRPIIDALSVSYDTPPTRILSTSGEVEIDLPEEEPQVKLLHKVLEKCEVDVFWTESDPYRVLLGTIFIRYYPEDTKKRIYPRRILPNQIFRIPGAVDPTDIELDQAFCIALSGDLYEEWNNLGFDAQLGRNVWSCFVVQEDGQIVERPFGDDGICPYRLPVQSTHIKRFFNSPFITPPQSRISHQENINKALTDLHATIENQVFSLLIIKTNNPAAINLTETGPGKAIIVSQEDIISPIDFRPQIDSAMDSIRATLGMWLESEAIPSDRFDRSGVIKTGEARKVENIPLKERREAILHLVKKEQQVCFEIIRSIWNHKSNEWNVPKMREDLMLKVVPADVPEVQTPKDLLDVALREIELGVESKIGYIQAKKGISRSEAIQYLRIKEQDVVAEVGLFAKPEAPEEQPQEEQPSIPDDKSII